MDKVFSDALYVFSTLVQADAAILGIGAIFLIYKLQVIESVYQTSLQICSSEPGVGSDYIITLVADVPLEQKMLIALNQSQSRFKRPIRDLIFTEHIRRYTIGFTIPVIVLVALHCGTSAYFLRLLPSLFPDNVAVVNMYMSSITLSFIILLAVVSLTAGCILVITPAFAQRMSMKHRRAPHSIFELAKSYSESANIRALFPLKYKSKEFSLAFYRQSGLYSLNFMTTSPKDATQYLSQKSVDRVDKTQIEKVWAEFLADPNPYLRPQKVG